MNSVDVKLRAFGFEIAHRPKSGEDIWVHVIAPSTRRVSLTPWSKH